MAVVVRQAVPQLRAGNVGLSAVLRVGVLRFALDIDDVYAAIAHCDEQPCDVLDVLFDRVGEVEAAAPALRAGHDEEIRKAVAVYAEERLRPF